VGFVAQHLASQVQVGAHTRDAGIIFVIADDFDFRPGDFHNQLDQFVNAGFPAAADIYDQVVNAWCGGGCDHSVDYIVDEYVVACLTAIAMHYQCAAPDSLTQESWV